MTPPDADPVMISLRPTDAERIKELEEIVWFSVSPGLAAEDVVRTLDFTRARAIEAGPAPDGGPAQLASMYAH